MTTFLIIILLAIAAWTLPGYWQRWRRYRLRHRPLTPQQQQLLQECLPLYKNLTPAMQVELRGNMSLFLHDKEFVGCNGLQVTEYMRIAVAAHASLLLLGRETLCYPDLYTVLLYPDTYVARETRRDGYVETTHHSAREGEAHYRGPVVLSWGDMEQDLQNPEQGHNVALHEFAHKLDEEDGYFDGRPAFENTSEGKNWASILAPEFERLRQQRDNRGSAAQWPPVLDFYGAESPAEFFAVATEAFFMIPAALQENHTALYGELCRFYHLDPAALQRGSLPDN